MESLFWTLHEWLTRSMCGTVWYIKRAIWVSFLAFATRAGRLFGFFAPMNALFYYVIRMCLDHRNTDIRFLNFGFVPIEKADRRLLQKAEAKIAMLDKQRNCARLYEFVLSQLPFYAATSSPPAADENHNEPSPTAMAGMRLVELGAGRGGGIRWIKSAHPELAFVQGIDLVPSLLCADVIEGDVHDLPYEDASVDVLVNVESSHCYSDQAKFFAEVQRVLKPGGHFVWCDFMPRSFMADFWRSVRSARSLKLVQYRDISKEVLKSLSDKDSLGVYGEAIRQAWSSTIWKHTMHVFAAYWSYHCADPTSPGTYHDLSTGSWTYTAGYWRKSEAAV